MGVGRRLGAIGILAMAMACTEPSPAGSAVAISRRFALAPGQAVAFEPGDRGLSPVFAQGVTAIGTQRRALVSLPARADGPLRVTDLESGLWLEARLEGALPVAGATEGGYRWFPGALEGADLLQRPEVEGVEDLLALSKPPPGRRVAWRVGLSHTVAGLRLVANTLELLDAAGTPRLRVTAPWIRDAAGRVEEPRLSLAGCAADDSALGPWGRPLTPPGRESCLVELRWSETVGYPALLDPGWTTTGSMATPRSYFAMGVLPDGHAIAAGGVTYVNPPSLPETAKAELFDPASRTWAATADMGGPRAYHQGVVLDGRFMAVGGQDDAGTAYPHSTAFDPASGLWTSYFHTVDINGRRGRSSFMMAPYSAGGGNWLLAAGGRNNGFLATAERFNFDAGWANVGNLPSGTRVAGVAATHANEVYVLAGSDGTNPAPIVDRYNHTTGWSTGGTTASTLVQANIAVVPVPASNPRFIVAGSSSGTTAQTTSRIYDPVTNLWSIPGNGMPTARYGAAAVTLPTGQALFLGGVSPSEPSSTSAVDLYDPVSNNWSATTPMAAARRWHGAVLLQNGKVLTCG
ncbi:MAG: Kelch repeat-containing protein, partial [Myxococcaceae bacterium]